MAITPFGAASNPADNGSLADVAAISVIPPPGMVSGDLTYMIAEVRTGSQSLDIVTTGGQSWTAETLMQNVGGARSMRVFWCRFNGTWPANPSVGDSLPGTNPISLFMGVWRPTSGTNTWAVDVAQTIHQIPAPVSPFDVTAPGRTAIAPSTVSIFAFGSSDDNTWGNLTAGFSNAGGAQYRNIFGSDLSLSIAYKIQTSAGATGDVTIRQLTNGGDGTTCLAITFKEQSSGVTLASVNAGSTPLLNGQTGVVFTGAKSGATWASFKISPTNDINDVAAVTQSIASQTATTITLNALSLSSFTRFVDLYAFATDSGGASNSSGFVIRRGSVATITAQFQNIPGSVNQANLTGIIYAIYPTNDVLGTALGSGVNATTDASGNLSALTYTLASGGPLSAGDDVVLFAWKGNVSAASTLGTAYQLTPSYS